MRGKLSSELLRRGAEVELLDRRVRWKLMQAWREIYAKSVKVQTGRWTINGHDWHAFSGGSTRSKSGHQALELYLAEHAAVLIAVPRSDHEEASLFQRIAPPDLTDLYDDVYVFPEDLSWTMSFTHEPGFGPYFSRRVWCDPFSPDEEPI